MIKNIKKFPAWFFSTEKGRCPVLEWLMKMPQEDRQRIGEDIRTVEYGWPIGMPLCRSIKGEKGLWEVRTNLSKGRIARIFFCTHKGRMAVLHGFIKKSQKTPTSEITIAVKRMKGLDS